MNSFKVRISNILVTLLLLFAACTAGISAVRLPKLISNGMVLQRETPITIWGWAEPKEEVTIRFLEKQYHTVTGSDGKWQVQLPSMKAGGPYSMQIDATNHITLNNIAIGDVWVCSGQSNMALTMERVKEKYPDVIAHSENNFIRHFFLATRFNFHQTEEDLPGGSWETASPQTLLAFSAVGYFYAKNLYDRYHVPVGLINSSVGGSPAEAWLSKEALMKFPEYFKVSKMISRDNYVDSIRTADNNLRDNWYRELEQKDLGQHDKQKWYAPQYDASSWPSMSLPGYWDEQGLPGINGVVWFRKEFTLPATAAGKPAQLLMGRIVDRDSVFVNGVFVGAISYQYPPRRYTVPTGVLKEGKNTIVVRVINQEGRGGFITDKPYQLTVQEATIDLKGQWQYRLGAAMKPLPGPTFFQYKPGGLYNAMIAPLLNYKIKGAVWYQGESNAGRPADYQSLLTTLIADWRAHWNEGNFPFLFVQLANFMEPKATPSESGWAQLREAQRKTLTVANTGMAVAIDVGEWNDIHPLNKEAVGKRLALAAASVAYSEKKFVFSGPLYQAMKIDGNKIILTFTNAGSGLAILTGDKLNQFAIAGSDHKFVWANAKIEGNTVVVWNDTIANPRVVRYAWADNPQGANLGNKEGLPASPFSTDN